MTPRPFYWSVRRELWENRSVVLAPLVAAGVVLFGFTLSAAHLPEHRREVLALDPARRAAAVMEVYHLAAAAVILTGMIVMMFYCLGALYNERRDRGILFWKSLPVSDLITVLSKAAIPMLVAPAVLFGVAMGLQVVMAAMTSTILLANGVALDAAGTQVPLLGRAVDLMYGVTVLTLWYAPIWAWLLLVSAWARRAPFLWATLPVLALCLVEKLAFDSTEGLRLLAYRLGGVASEAFSHGASDETLHGMRHGVGLGDMDPGRFVTGAGLWTGLIAAAAFLAAAVWLRRRREPI